MAEVIRGNFGARRKSGWGKYEAQETGEPPDSPDVGRPPEREFPEPDEHRRETPESPGAPPFTGEDLDAGDPPKRDRPRPM